jgi:hypothetical protein
VESTARGSGGELGCGLDAAVRAGWQGYGGGSKGAARIAAHGCGLDGGGLGTYGGDDQFRGRDASLYELVLVFGIKTVGG